MLANKDKGTSVGFTDFNQEERFICEIIWGAVPTDISWAKSTQIFKDAVEKFKTDTDWQNLYLNKNKQI